MIRPVDQIKKSSQLQTQSLRIQNNIPVDTRFIINSLSTLDTEIPLKYRYEGLIFFVMDEEIFDGTVVTKVGAFYCFEADLSNPVPLSEVSNRFIVLSVGGFENDYTTLFEKLNRTYSQIGSIVYVDELGVFLNKYGNGERDWKFSFGTYKVLTEAEFYTIPIELREPGKYININNQDKIILNDTNHSISEVIMVFARREDITEWQNYRYYLINGFLYYYISDTLYNSGGDKFTYYPSTILQEGVNEINHNFNSTYIIAYIRIYNNDIENIEFDSNAWFPLDISIKDSNNVIIKSSLSISRCDIIIISKQ
jgi:hypothetical protein